MNRPPAPLVLASGSATRRKLLDAAGLAIIQDPADLDENIVKEMLGNRPDAGRLIAERLAADKALCVAPRHRGARIIGADQTLCCGSRLFDKPGNRDEAAEHLRFLRGRQHVLTTAVAVAEGDRVLWSHVAEARLSLRPFDDAELEAYLDRAGPEALDSVGAYRLEGPAIGLFERIDGDWFTILGLPMLPLLAFLRQSGAMS